MQIVEGKQKTLLFWAIALFGFTFAFLIYPYINEQSCGRWMPSFDQAISGLILPRLVDADLRLPKNDVDAVYILGGSQNSLIQKFQVVYDLCRKRNCKKILMLSRPGITEYSPPAGRNLTNDEWASAEMKKIGIPVEKINFIKMEDGYFGTHNEAKNISRIIIGESYTSVVLISSDYHTRRVRISFEQFLKHKPVKVYVYGSHTNVSASGLLVEYVKLKFYQTFLT